MSEGSELTYPVRFQVVLKYFGLLCLVLSALGLVPFICALVFREYFAALAYGLIVLGTASVGGLLARMKPLKTLQINESIVIVCLIFLFAPLSQALGMMVSGLSYGNALFEAISGITTTGLSVISDVNQVSKSVILNRAWMQWYGGLGIALFSIILLLSSGTVFKDLLRIEQEPEDLIGGAKPYSIRILKIYLLFTVLETASLFFLGRSFFDAIAVTFASVSTGGFTPFNDSLRSFGIGEQSVVLIFCFFGANALSLFYWIFTRNWKIRADVVQFFSLLVCIAVVFTSLIFLWHLNDYAVASFLTFSAQTTTGFSTNDVSQLDAGSKLILIFSMFIGGGAGSTAGGVKIIRLLVIVKALFSLVRKTSMTPHAVHEARFLHKKIDESELKRMLMVVLLFFTVNSISWIPFIVMGYNPLDALFEVVSATGIVGLSTGITGPDLPGVLKAVLCVDMFLGRLEIIPWLVLASKTTWIGQRMEVS